MALRSLILSLGVLLVATKLSNALQCYYCNSITDENCATLKQNTTDVECNDDCAVWMTGSTTYRGCESEVPEDASDSKVCDTDGCNNIIFPAERMKCVKCSFDDDFCMTPDANLLYPCKNYQENDSCYTYVSDETFAIRGCLSDQDENVNLCNSVGDSCIKCSEEFCNLQRGKSYLECQTCSSEVDGEACGYSQGAKSTKLCEEILGRDNFCFAFTNETHSIRGCLNDYPDLKTNCEENSEECQVCTEDSCNSMKLIEETCYVCDSTSNEDCESVAEFQTPTLCGEGTFDKSGCYLFDKDNVIRRGCVTELTEEELGECHVSDDCKICHGNMCNVKQSFQKCFVCDSSDDSNCATVEGTLEEKVCDDYLDTCKVFVIPNMTTHRGCSKEMTSDDICSPQSVNCKTCLDNNCNGEVFPSNRLSCFHCEGANSSETCYESLDDDNLDLSYPCETYNFRDSCYFYIDDKKVVHRGCLSDDDTVDEICQADPIKCKTCQGSNCNSESVLKSPELSCISCDTSGVEECNWGWSTESASKCQKEIFFYEEETCFTFSFEDQIIRGCTMDQNVCKISPCELCSDGDACNRGNFVEQICHQCSSEDDSSCGPNPTLSETVVCSGIIQYDHRGCYTWIDDDKKVKRGCYSDLTAEEKTMCTADDKNCERCVDEANCNDKLKGSSGSLAFNLILMISMFVVSLI